MSDTVTQFRPNSPMGEVAKDLERLIKTMRRHNMGSLLCHVGDFAVSIKTAEPSAETQPGEPT